MPFAPIRKQQISDLVFEQLRESIYRGELKIGDRLPSERDLAEVMGVSRSSVRKAISRLVDMGYVENRQSQGTYVMLPEPRDPANPFAYVMSPGQSSLDELMERLEEKGYLELINEDGAELNEVIMPEFTE